MHVQVADISFARFIHPFVFRDADANALAAIVDRLRPMGWVQGTFPEGDLLPHVRDYLNPHEGGEATAYLLQMGSETLARFAQQTLHSANDSNAQWRMQLGDRQLPFVLDGAQLAIFRGGVALLTLDARPLSHALDDWLDFVYHFRAFAGKAGDAQDLSAPELHYGDATIQGIQPLIDCLLEPAYAHAAEELFMRNLMLPFTALYLDGELTEQEKYLLLYRVRLCFGSRHELHPPCAELRPDHPCLLEYAHEMWFTFAQQAAGFVALNAPGSCDGFFRGDLPRRLRNRYFLLYQLVLHQKFMLMHFSDQVSESWLRGDEDVRMRTFTRIRDALLEFTARGYFAQVMQLEQHHRYYCRWRETLQLETLYQEVSDEVREMHDYLQLQLERRRVEQSEQLNRVVLWLTGVTVFFALPSLFVSFLGANVRQLEAWDSRLPALWWLWTVGAFALAGVIIVFAITRMSRVRRR
ncbi:MAG: CorA family divalent cation transporter [Fimbriimonadales bacterium]|nr:MAG: hypothetical protein KatS3mg018_2586 [Fimbriimonadales bacterium]